MVESFTSAVMDTVLTISPFHRDTNSTTMTLQWQQGKQATLKGSFTGCPCMSAVATVIKRSKGTLARKCAPAFQCPKLV